MTNLIARLEAATEESRELDAEIALATFYHEPDSHDDSVYVKLPHKHDECAAGTYWLVSRSGMSLRTAPNYTTSIDAALTLVPAGHWWEVRQMADPRSPMRDFGSSGIFTARIGFSYGSVGFPGHHDRPALALCTAALKARQGDDHG